MGRTEGLLPERLPSDPLPLAASWLRDARRAPSETCPDGMVLATTGADGVPDARVVLCKHWVSDPGFVVFGTSYESPTKTDWLEIDFGRAVEFRRVELAIYDDRGGVQPPTSYVIQHWTGTEWHEVSNTKKSPEQPLGSQWNEACFDPLTSSKVRIVFTHRGQSRSGVSEVLIWND